MLSSVYRSIVHFAVSPHILDTTLTLHCLPILCNLQHCTHILNYTALLCVSLFRSTTVHIPLQHPKFISVSDALSEESSRERNAIAPSGRC